MCKPDYSFYKDVFGGTLTEDLFGEAVAEAESFVKYLIGWNEVDTDEKREAYMRACCAAVDAFAQYGDGAIGGFSIGSFSTTQTSYTGSPNARDVANQKARGELLKVGLLWGGIQ